jgi:glycosyltransferase involved in cell wall biosynthesis
MNGGSEIITHGCDGFVLENPANSEVLAALIRTLVDDPALRDRLGAAAVATATRYTWDRNAAQMRELFESVVRSGGT